MYYKCVPFSGGTNLIHLVVVSSAHCFYHPAFPIVTIYFLSLYICLISLFLLSELNIKHSNNSNKNKQTKQGSEINLCFSTNL